MPLLKDPQGPYNVGATTLVLPLTPYIPTGSAKIRNSSGELEPALLAEEVTFTAFYPTPKSSRTTYEKGLDWLARPLADTVNGYAHFTGVSRWLFWPAVLLYGTMLKIPVYKNAPPMHPSSEEDAWPIVLYSHGIGSDNTTYSQMCSHLASHGKVVLSFQHHDGSGPVMRPRSSRTGRTQALSFLRPEDVFWEDGQPCGLDAASRYKLRVQMIDMRRLEIYFGFRAFSQLVSAGQRGKLQIEDGTPIHSSWLAKKWARTDARVSIAGHSFGGGTVIDLLSQPPPRGHAFSEIPITHALALDPWIDPLSSNPTAYTGLQAAYTEHPKLLVITAEKMALWAEHFKRILTIVSTWEGSGVISVVGSNHVSFADLPVMLPWPVRPPTARPILKVINDVSLGFFDNRLADTLSRMPTRPMKIEERKRPWYKFWGPKTTSALVGKPGDLIVNTDETVMNEGEISM